MILTNETKLRSYLASVQSKARTQAKLLGEYALHPDNKDGSTPARSAAPLIVEGWEILRRDLPKVLGSDVQLIAWHQLCSASSFEAPGSTGYSESNSLRSPDPYQISLGSLKKKADKARLRDPTITLLRSWSK